MPAVLELSVLVSSFVLAVCGVMPWGLLGVMGSSMWTGMGGMVLSLLWGRTAIGRSDAYFDVDDCSEREWCSQVMVTVVLRNGVCRGRQIDQVLYLTYKELAVTTTLLMLIH